MTDNAWSAPSISERTEQVTLNLRAKDTLAKLTPAGREFMRLVGSGHFDFFDDGIVETSGNWGGHMAWQAAKAMGKADRSMGGIMGRLAADELGLWHLSEYDTDCKDVWWSLTALGAEVALVAAGLSSGVAHKDGGTWSTERPGPSPDKPKPTEKRTRTQLVAAIRGAGYTGPVTGKDFPTVTEVAALAQKLEV